MLVAVVERPERACQQRDLGSHFLGRAHSADRDLSQGRLVEGRHVLLDEVPGAALDHDRSRGDGIHPDAFGAHVLSQRTGVLDHCRLHGVVGTSGNELLQRSRRRDHGDAGVVRVLQMRHTALHQADGAKHVVLEVCPPAFFAP